MTDDDRRDLYDLDNEASSFTRSLREADAVYCTDWDSQDPLDVDAVMSDAYHAPLQTVDDFFLQDGAYPNTVSDSELVGCKIP